MTRCKRQLAAMDNHTPHYQCDLDAGHDGKHSHVENETTYTWPDNRSLALTENEMRYGFNGVSRVNPFAR